MLDDYGKFRRPAFCKAVCKPSWDSTPIDLKDMNLEFRGPSLELPQRHLDLATVKQMTQLIKDKSWYGC